jgi:hypothetical protein
VAEHLRGGELVGAHMHIVDPKDDCDTDECIMTISDYNYVKKSIATVLRCKTDPPPRSRVTPGSMQAASSFVAIRAFLQCSEGGNYRMVRGYKLFTLSRNAHGGCMCYVAKPHGVLEHTKTGRFMCLVRNPGTVETDFIFVPSSLMHVELSDDQLCSGRFLLCDVIGGDPRAVADLTAVFSCLSRFHQRRLTTRPGQIAAPPLVYVRYFPGFLEWFRSVERTVPEAMLVDVAMSFGMTFRPIGPADQEDADMDVACTQEEVVENPRDLIDPQPPFEHEKGMWLPSVPTLHEYYNLSSHMFANVTLAEQFPMYSAMYNSLQKEYWERLWKTGRRHKAEYSARVCGEWR